MALQAHAGIRFAHTGAIIFYLDENTSCLFDQKSDRRCTGINGIFHEFFHHRRGSLYHFSCRNLIGYGVRKKTDDVGHAEAGKKKLLLEFQIGVGRDEQQ